MEEKLFTKILNEIVESLCEAGYKPTDQLVGYVKYNDPCYITRKNDAREKILLLDLEQLRKYLKEQGISDHVC